MRFKKSYSLYSSLLPLIFLLVLLGTGRVLYSINLTLNGEIYNNSDRKAGTVTPADWNLPYQNISFESDGLTIKGWFVDNETTSRAIILAPGRGVNREAILRQAPIKNLHNNFDLLFFDPRSIGESEGEKYGFGYFEARNIVHAVHFLREEKEEVSVGVWGGSAGASAAIMAALETSEIDAVIADSPYANLELAAKEWEMTELAELLFPVYMTFAKIRLKFNPDQTNLLNRIEKLKTPLFLIHGQEDRVLKPQHSQLLYEKVTGPKKLWLVEKAGHLQSYKLHPKEYERKAIAFLTNYLPKS